MFSDVLGVLMPSGTSRNATIDDSSSCGAWHELRKSKSWSQNNEKHPGTRYNFVNLTVLNGTVDLICLSQFMSIKHRMDRLCLSFSFLFLVI